MQHDTTPRSLGYRWPAEWEPHAATWLAWPHNRETWPGKFAAIPGHFARLIRTLARYEPVEVLAGQGPVLEQARQLVGNLPGVRLHPIETNDAWTRDHGPTFLVHPQLRQWGLVDWQYNAWGGKYPPFDKDNDVPRRIAQACGWQRFAADVVVEGGAIEGNGRGTLLTTLSCLCDERRNPDKSRAEMENWLSEYACARHVLWLATQPIPGDDTDGHIDQLARFVQSHTIVAAACDDPQDETYHVLQENLRQLRTMTDQDGRRLEVIPLPLPEPRYEQNQRLPASYCNFYIANGAVLVPQFEDPRHDAAALELLARLFPNRQVIGLPALEIVWGLGAFHCLTQQQPAADCGDSQGT